jgi:NADPH-dependent curcumin reductase
MTSTRETNRVIRLASHPVGTIADDDLALTEEAVPEPADGEALVRTRYLSLDPAIRVWMTGVDSYVPGIKVGDTMRGGGIGQVLESRSPEYRAGDLVFGMMSWADYATFPAGALRVVPPREPLTALLSVCGVTGLTAYFGLLEVGRPREGETVVVSGAAGATGSVAGQIAKIHGCRVVGIAGTGEKCAWVTEDLGFDACINYKTDDVAGRLAETCPAGIDVYFDNVGGEILDHVLTLINLRARVVLCGAISQYNAVEPAPGPRNLFTLIPQRGRMEGFIVIDYLERFPEAIEALGAWVDEGRITHAEHVVDGLEQAPAAMRMLFTGANTGKLIVKVSEA